MTPTTFIQFLALTALSWGGIALWAIVGLLTMPIPALAMNHTHMHEEGVSITDAWARATPTGSKVGAVYLTIQAPKDDVLVSAKTEIAGRTELHQTTQDLNGALQMRELAAGVDLPAGKAISFAPGGTHIMLMDLKNPLKEGYEIPVTLTFKKAGVHHTRAVIKPISYMPGMGGDSMPYGERHDHHGYHSHGHHHHH